MTDIELEYARLCLATGTADERDRDLLARAQTVEPETNAFLKLVAAQWNGEDLPDPGVAALAKVEHCATYVRVGRVAPPAGTLRLRLLADASEVLAVMVDRKTGIGRLLPELGAEREHVLDRPSTVAAEIRLYAPRTAPVRSGGGELRCLSVGADGHETIATIAWEPAPGVAVLVQHGAATSTGLAVRTSLQGQARFACAVVPLAERAPGAAFRALAHSKGLGARYSYVELQPGDNLLHLRWIEEGPALYELVPWPKPGARAIAPEPIAAIALISRPGKGEERPGAASTAKIRLLVISSLADLAPHDRATWLDHFVRCFADRPEFEIHVLNPACEALRRRFPDALGQANVIEIACPGLDVSAGDLADLASRIDGTAGGYDSVIMGNAAIAKAMRSRSLRARSIVVDPVRLTAPRSAAAAEVVASSFARLAAARAARDSSQHSAHILVAAHDYKFFDGLQDALRNAGHRVTHDVWHGHHRRLGSLGPGERSAPDVVLCDWCLGNAVWWSRHVAPRQRLVIRFHSQELLSDLPAKVDYARVDAVVFVSPHIMREAVARFAIPVEKCRVVPITVDFAPASPRPPAERQWKLGLVGFVPWLKRPDRALAILRQLRQADDRFRLVIKGAMPSDYPWMAGRGEELASYASAFRQLVELERGDAVERSGFDPDIADFYGGIGWILSVSDREGCHTAVAEGGVCGAVPLILDWPGARELYPGGHVYGSEQEIVAGLLRQLPDFERLSAHLARDFAARYRVSAVLPQWQEVLGLERGA